MTVKKRRTMRSKMAAGILAGTLTLCLVALGVELYLQGWIRETHLITVDQVLEMIVHNENDQLASDLFDQQARALQRRAQMMVTKDNIVGVEVFGPNYTLVAAAGTPAPVPPACLSSASTPRTTSEPETFQGITTDTSYLFCKTISAIGQQLGHISITYSLEPLQNQMRKRWILFSLFMCAIVTVILITLVLLLDKMLIKPVVATRDEVRKMAGNLFCLTRDAQTETEEIREAAAAMAERLRYSEANLEAKLAELEYVRDHLGRIYNRSREGYFLSSTEGELLKCNPALADIFGYESAEELQHAAAEGISSFYARPEDRIRLLRALDRRGSLNGYEVLGRRKDGKTIWFEISATLLTDEDGVPRFIEGAILDITERRLKEQAEKEKRAAIANSKSKSEFLANMSHEIRTPLNGVLSMLQLANDTELTADQRTYIEKAIMSGRSLLRLISDILDLSRVEAGKLELIPESFRPEVLVNDVVESFQQRTKEKGIELYAEIASNLPKAITADRSRLRQVLSNLVDNALKNTNDGEIVVRLSSLPVVDPKQCRLLFSVEDTGIGIPDSQQAEIFDSFRQAETTLPRRTQGAGLGLAIVKSVVDLMGGNTTLDSTEGEGTTVWFTVFAQVATLDDTPKPQEFSEPATKYHGPMRVLVAEDEPVNQLSIRKFLEKAGHSSLCVDNGREAIDVLEREFRDGAMFDCVIMDIQMPVMDGITATRHIRRGTMPNIPKDIPIIAMTAHAMSGDRERLLGEGIDYYIAKPVELPEVVDVLASIASRRHNGSKKRLL